MCARARVVRACMHECVCVYPRVCARVHVYLDMHACMHLSTRAPRAYVRVQVKIAESGVQEKATLIVQSALALVLEQAEKTKQLVTALADKKPATGGI